MEGYGSCLYQAAEAYYRGKTKPVQAERVAMFDLATKRGTEKPCAAFSGAESSVFGEDEDEGWLFGLT